MRRTRWSIRLALAAKLDRHAVVCPCRRGGPNPSALGRYRLEAGPSSERDHAQQRWLGPRTARISSGEGAAAAAQRWLGPRTRSSSMSSEASEVARLTRLRRTYEACASHSAKACGAKASCFVATDGELHRHATDRARVLACRSGAM